MVHISLVETLQVNELHGKWKNKGCRSWRELEALSWVSSSCHQTFIPDGQRSGFFIGGGCALLVCLRHLEVAKRKKEYCGKELQSEHLELEDTVTPILRFLPLSLKKSVQWLSGLRVWCCDCCGSGYSCGVCSIPGSGNSTYRGRCSQIKEGGWSQILDLFPSSISYYEFCDLGEMT